jgi:hypothetical protein
MIKEFKFNFANINSVKHKIPACRIELNGHEIFAGDVQREIIVQAGTEQSNTLRVHFQNKTGADTILDDANNITQDLSFELQKLVIDNVDVEHLIWQSKYVTDDSVIDSCLFFGPRGFWEFTFDLPILKWFLKMNHTINNNDPDWEKDYNYYKEAWDKLSKIQTR